MNFCQKSNLYQQFPKNQTKKKQNDSDQYDRTSSKENSEKRQKDKVSPEVRKEFAEEIQNAKAETEIDNFDIQDILKTVTPSHPNHATMATHLTHSKLGFLKNSLYGKIASPNVSKQKTTNQALQNQVKGEKIKETRDPPPIIQPIHKKEQR